MKIIILKIVFLTIFLLSQNSFAQFGRLSSLLESNDNETEESTADTLDLVSTYNLSLGFIIDAQIRFANALGLQEQSELLSTQRQILGQGNLDQDAYVTLREVSDSVQLEIDAIAKEGNALDSQSRADYANGLLNMIKGIYEARNLPQAAQEAASNTVSSLGGGGLSGLLNSASSATVMSYVIADIPNYFNSFVESGKLMIEYGRSNEIAPPEEATSMMDMFSL